MTDTSHWSVYHWVHDIILAFASVNGASRTKIEEVTLNALRTRQSLVKGERLVRTEVRAVLRTWVECWTNYWTSNRLVGRLKRFHPRSTHHAPPPNHADVLNCVPAHVRVQSVLVCIDLPKRVCHTQRKCNARGDKWKRPKQASGHSPPIEK